MHLLLEASCYREVESVAFWKRLAQEAEAQGLGYGGLDCVHVMGPQRRGGVFFLVLMIEDNRYQRISRLCIRSNDIYIYVYIFAGHL